MACAGHVGNVRSTCHGRQAPHSEYTVSECYRSSAAGGSAKRPSSRLTVARIGHTYTKGGRIVYVSHGDCRVSLRL